MSVVLEIVVVSPASRPAHESLIGRFAKVLGHFTKVSFSLVFFEVFNCPKRWRNDLKRQRTGC